MLEFRELISVSEAVDTAKVGALGNLKFEASNVKFSDA